MSRTSSSRRRPSVAPQARPKQARPEKPIPQTPRQRELSTKRRGELAELAFVLKAANQGLGVSRPYGDSERYDFILDTRDVNVGRTLPSASSGQALSAAVDLSTDSTKKNPRKIAGTKNEKSSDASRKRKTTRNAEKNKKNIPLRQPSSIPAAHTPDPSPPLWRVQVKCSTQLSTGLYRVNAHRRSNGHAVPYRPGEIHFFAAYIIPEDTWYIIPLPAVRGVTSLLFRRRRDPRPGLYDAYREAWHLLRP
jgi:hypothetical protein